MFFCVFSPPFFFFTMVATQDLTYAYLKGKENYNRIKCEDHDILDFFLRVAPILRLF